MGGKSRKTGMVSRRLIEKLKRKSSCVGGGSKGQGLLSQKDIQPSKEKETSDV